MCVCVCVCMSMSITVVELTTKLISGFDSVPIVIDFSRSAKQKY